MKTLTNGLLFQKCEREYADAGEDVAVNIEVAIPIDAAGRTKELQRRLDGAGEPENEQDEAAEDDDARKKQALGNEVYYQEEEEDGEAGGAELEDEEPSRSDMN